MKSLYLKENTLIEKGREITIYIYKYDERYKHGFIGCDLSLADENSEAFWLDLIKTIEKALEANKIQSNGCAEGDLKLGKYISIRNESYIVDKKGNELTLMIVEDEDRISFKAVIKTKKKETKFIIDECQRVVLDHLKNNIDAFLYER